MSLLTRIEDPHQVYNEALQHLRINGQPPKIIRSRLLHFTSRYYVIRIGISALSALFLVFDIYRARPRRQAVFVREFWNIPLLLTAPFLFARRKDILFNINHNLSGSRQGGPWTIIALARAGFQFVLFDGEKGRNDLPAATRSAFHTPFFPCSEMPKPRKDQGGPLRIGIVGSFGSIEEAGPTLAPALNRLSHRDDIALCYGARGEIPKPLRGISKLQIVDTKSRDGFQTYLQTLDCMVFIASAKNYYYRHSGSVMDAVAGGVIPIVPAFPVLGSQVAHPVQIGPTFMDFDDLAEVIHWIRENRGRLDANRQPWSAARRETQINLGARR